jgi:ribosome biogenesis protein SSF1/2
VSSAAGDDGDAVSLAGDYVGRNNRRGQKKAVKLDEIGPRMELRLIKITEGLPGKEGGVIYHDIGSYLTMLLRVLMLHADAWKIISQEDEERDQRSENCRRREGTAQEAAEGGARTERREEESSCCSEKR